jgi:hypothetical protein
MASNHTHTHDEEALIATLLANGVSGLTPSVAASIGRAARYSAKDFGNIVD